MKSLPPYFTAESEIAVRYAAIEHAVAPPDVLRETAHLGWVIRERDTARARTLADKVLALTDRGSQHATSELARAVALNTLAEISVLDGELDKAVALAGRAAAAFEQLGCLSGVGDAHLVRAAVAFDRSQSGERADLVERARAFYEQAGDEAREHVAIARLAHVDIYRNQIARWLSWLDERCEEGDAGVGALALETRAAYAFSKADYATSARDWHRAYDTALISGQRRIAISSLIGVGISFANLGDASASLEWLERALGLAREHGWPVLLGQALQQYGMSFVELKRWDAARVILKESTEVLRPFTPSRRLSLSLAYWGELAFETGDYAAALDSFCDVQQQADQIRDTDMRIRAAIGQARALSRLERIEDAAHHARIGLEMAEILGDPAVQSVALRTFADVLRFGRGRVASGVAGLDSPIACLERSLDISKSIEGFTMEAEVYSELAADYAEAGQFRRAYEAEQCATEIRKRTFNKEATDRVTALQVRYETERASARAEHLEAMAGTLQAALATLELVGEIGKEITAKLDPESVFDALNRHLGRLMDAAHLSIFQMCEDPPRLEMRFGISSGVPIAPTTIAFDDPLSKIARCARQRTEIHQNGASPPGRATLFPGTSPTASMAYLPLIADGRLLGVLSVQSPIENAYGQREQLVLRTLCAYGAVALANSIAVAELHETQDKLVAALGTLQTLATHDALTGAVNRGGFYECADREIHEARVSQADLSVILFDLDHFKDINDTWGHGVGDEVLQAVVRITDLHGQGNAVARLGGEEFALLMPRVGPVEAAALAHHLCEIIGATPITTKRSSVHVTASFAVATLEKGDGNIDDLLARADATLYDAKHAGRNRVRLAGVLVDD
ncbi:putative diguanylate cyclase [Pararobbsia alpina]|uniref:diguanylate cyclase n=1 Tax=Pararobbsia alpina TaxID=621374 RepID=UPI0039A5A331